MKKIVITGVNGFAGQHLVHELKRHDIEVIGIGSEPSTGTQIDYQYISSDLAKHWPDLGHADAIIHLAGLAAVGPSFDNPQRYIDINSRIVTNMCEYYLERGSRPRIVAISSGAVYASNQDMPLSESSRVGYNSPYVVSKILLENQIQYYSNRGLDCVVARPFNHIGPKQKAGFLLPDLYAQLVKAKGSKVIKVGNLKTKRDYTDVRDIVRAYYLLATQDKLDGNVYNICSGTSVSGEEILEKLQAEMQLADIEVRIDKDMIRPNDTPDIKGDSSRLTSDTGWRPQIDLNQTIKDFVDEKIEKA